MIKKKNTYTSRYKYNSGVIFRNKKREYKILGRPLYKVRCLKCGEVLYVKRSHIRNQCAIKCKCEIPVNNLNLIKNLPGEIWKDLPRYEGLYKVSNLGRVKSCITDSRSKEMLVKPYFYCNKYVVSLSDKDYKRRTCSLGKLLYIVFVDESAWDVKKYRFEFRDNIQDLEHLEMKNTSVCNIGDIVSEHYTVIGYENLPNNNWRDMKILIKCNKCNDILKIKPLWLKNKTQTCSCYPKRIRGIGRGGDGTYTKNKRVYATLSGMKNRCYSKKNKAYKYYGGKGIFICKFWLDSFENFLNWWYSIDPDDKNKLTIDRIDSRYEYAPYNCELLSRSAHSKKSVLDTKKTEEQLKEDEIAFNKRKTAWLEEMRAKGYDEKDLI